MRWPDLRRDWRRKLCSRIEIAATTTTNRRRLEYFSNDPIGFEAGDANLSRYVFNNPLRFTDPDGLAVCLGEPKGTGYANDQLNAVIRGLIVAAWIDASKERHKEQLRLGALHRRAHAMHDLRQAENRDNSRVRFPELRKHIERRLIDRKENEGITQEDIERGRAPAATEPFVVERAARHLMGREIVKNDPSPLNLIPDYPYDVVSSPVMKIRRNGPDLAVGVDKLGHFFQEGLLLYDVYDSQRLRFENHPHNMEQDAAKVLAKQYAVGLAYWLEGGLPEDLPEDVGRRIFEWLVDDATTIEYNYCGIPLESSPKKFFGIFADRHQQTFQQIDRNGYVSPADVNAAVAGMEFWIKLEQMLSVHGAQNVPVGAREITQRADSLIFSDFIDDGWDHLRNPNQVENLLVHPKAIWAVVTGQAEAAWLVIPQRLEDVPKVILPRP